MPLVQTALAAKSGRRNPRSPIESMIVDKGFEGYLKPIGTGGVILRATNGKIIGVLLSRAEYELLVAAAAFAQNPQELVKIIRRKADHATRSNTEGLTFEEAFGEVQELTYGYSE